MPSNAFIQYDTSTKINKDNTESNQHLNLTSQEESYDIKGYVALETKQIVPIDDIQSIKESNEHSRRIIKPLKNNQCRISSSSDNTQKLWFTAGANYENRTSKNYRDSPEFGKFADNKDSPSRREGYKGGVINIKRISKSK